MKIIDLKVFITILEDYGTNPTVELLINFCIRIDISINISLNIYMLHYMRVMFLLCILSQYRN